MISIKIIKNNLDYPSVWDLLSQNPIIMWNDIYNNQHLSWNWDNISQNPNMTFEIIKNNADKPCNWNYISQNHFKEYKSYNNYLCCICDKVFCNFIKCRDHEINCN